VPAGIARSKSVVIDVIGWVLIGLIAGWNARRLVGQSSYTGYGPQGDFGFALLGAIVGGIFARILGIGGPAAGNTFIWLSLILAAIGTIIALSIARATSRQPAR
jgi:uncharacterized membrane protein YeaQ/YmgE (transglycosylase-associated protein family)